MNCDQASCLAGQSGFANPGVDRRRSGRQADRQTERHRGRQTDRQTGRQTGRQPDRQAGRQTGRQRERQAGKQTDKQAGRQAGRRAGMHTDRQTYRQTGRQADTQGQQWWPPTWRSDRAFFMDAVPLKATTMVLWLQPIRQRVSSCSSQNSSLSVRWYSPRAVRKAKVVLSAWGRGVGGSLLVLGDMLRLELLRGLCAAPCKHDITPCKHDVTPCKLDVTPCKHDVTPCKHDVTLTRGLVRALCSTL